MSSRIVVDGSMVVVGGGCTFVLQLVPLLVRLAPDDRFLLLVRNPRLVQEIDAPPNLELRTLPAVGAVGILRFIARGGRAVAAEWKPDLWFSLSEYTPEGLSCPAVACFQNPNVWTDLRPGWPLSQRLRLKLLRWLALRSVGRCERITFLSEDSRRWMGRAIGLPEEQQALLPCGVTLGDWERTDPSAARHILSVGTVYRYKNYVRLIDAYAELAHHRPEAPDLRIVGKWLDRLHVRQMSEARSRAGDLAGRIHIEPWVSDDRLRQYYAEAAIFVFPSYLETFGIPLIEAMASRLPLVAADIPVFREVAGDVAYFADPHSSAALAQAMADALEDSELRRERIDRGVERARSYSWESAAAGLTGLFRAILNDRQGPEKNPPERPGSVSSNQSRDSINGDS